MNVGELFEVLHERARDGVKRAVRLAAAGEIDMRHPIGVFNLTVAGKTVEHEGQSLIALHAFGTLEVFIEHSANDVA